MTDEMEAIEIYPKKSYSLRSWATMKILAKN